MTTSADAPRAPRCSAFAERSPRRANLAVPHEIGGFAWISRVTYLAGDVRELVLSAVFKTVCGALLRRPGWVRFPSIPAMSCLRSSRPLSQLIRDQSRWGHPLVDPVGVHDQVAMGRPSSVQMRMCVGDASCDAFRLRAVARRVAESTKHKSLDTA